MKKLITSILLAVLLLGCLPTNTLAVSAQTQKENVIWFDDGSYITITLTETGSRASGTKTGTKTYNYSASNGDVAWKVVLTGTFTYTGSSATCTASSCNVTIYNSAWYVVSKTASKSGNKALADLTMGRKLLGIMVSKKSLSMQITCSANGTLS